MTGRAERAQALSGRRSRWQNLGQPEQQYNDSGGLSAGEQNKYKSTPT